jgi:hypothetical protein
MKEEEIIQNNLLIAQFMGYTKGTYDHGINGVEEIWQNYSIEDGHYKSEREFDYERDWNSLMPVVEKIESLGYFCMINRWTSVYTGFGQTPSQMSITNVEGKSKIGNTYRAVLAFIEWINSKNYKNE